MIPFGDSGCVDWACGGGGLEGDVAGGAGGPLEFVNPGPGNWGFRYFLPLYPDPSGVDAPRDPSLEAQWNGILESLGFGDRVLRQFSGWLDLYQQQLGLTLWRLWADGWPGAVMIREDGTRGREFPATPKGFLDFAGKVAAGSGEWAERQGAPVSEWDRYGGPSRIMQVLVTPVLVSSGFVSPAELPSGGGTLDNTQLLIDAGLLGPQTQVLRTTGVSDAAGYQEVVEVVAAGEDAEIPDRVYVPPPELPVTVEIEEPDGTRHIWSPNAGGLLLALGAVLLLRPRRPGR